MLTGQIEFVLVAHVEIGACDGTAGTGWRLSGLGLEVDFHFAAAILVFTAIPLTVHKIITVALQDAFAGCNFIGR